MGPRLWLRFENWLYRRAWPDYYCELCVGQDYGCECESMGSIAPGIPPTRKHLFGRWLYRKLYPQFVAKSR